MKIKYAKKNLCDNLFQSEIKEVESEFLYMRYHVSKIDIRKIKRVLLDENECFDHNLCYLIFLST